MGIRKFKHKFYVIPDLPVSVFIGADCTEKFNLVLQLKLGKLEEHLHHRKRVMERLRKTKLTINVEDGLFAEKKDMHRFPGLCNWHHVFVWTERQQQDFEENKELNFTDVVLSSINYAYPIIMKTDASSVDVGAVICRIIDQAVAIPSKLRKKAGRHYHINEKENFTLIFGCQKFRESLEDQKFFYPKG